MPLQGNLGLKWHLPDFNFDTEVLATFSKAVSHVSKDSSSSDEVFKPSGYAIYDAYLNWHPSKNITIRGSVLNIFDRRYFKWPMFSSYYKNPQTNVKVTNPIELQTAPGRTFAISAVINF